MNNNLLTKQQVADKLGVTTRHVDNLRADGKLNAVIVSPGAVRFDPVDVQAFIQEHKECERS